MKKTLPLFLLMIFFTVNACTPQTTTIPTLLPATPSEPPAAPQASSTNSPTQVDQAPTQKQYANSEFGISFQFPSNWFGPEEYVSDQTLRIEVGSDRVYPYGTGPEERMGAVKNSYHVVVQYSKNDQNTNWSDTYQSLANLQDGESLSGARSLIIRIRQLEIGRFKGFEYISTLSETAQTEAVYSREVILVDEQSNVLTIFGTPNNVEIGAGMNWRAVYKMLDEANLTFFHGIVESITLE